VLINVLIIIACVCAAIVFLLLVTRISSTAARRESNDFTGAVVAVMGTTYAVILAFTLSGVWSMAQQAQANEEQEANALVNVFRIASQLQDPNANRIQKLCVRYADNILQHEWAAMEKEQMTSEGADIINQLWLLVGQSQAHAQPDAIAAYQLMEELRGLTQYRRLRAMQTREHLPKILWAVLIAGGIITVGAASLFGVRKFSFHLAQVLALTFLIALVLVAIADIDRPYQGLVKVEPTGFEFAVGTFRTFPQQ
jgi:Ca2+/H+ antiporter